MAGKQGFASMTPERRAEIARKGGRAAHAKGTGHQWTSETARAAGRKGGESRAARQVAAPVAEVKSPVVRAFEDQAR